MGAECVTSGDICSLTLRFIVSYYLLITYFTDSCLCRKKAYSRLIKTDGHTQILRLFVYPFGHLNVNDGQNGTSGPLEGVYEAADCGR